MKTLQKDIVFWTFCQTLTSPSRNMAAWIQMDTQETILTITETWEIQPAQNKIYIRNKVEA